MKAHRFAGMLVMALAAGCTARTSVTQTWQAPASASVQPMRHLLVFGAKMEQANRRALEDGFVRVLAKHGVSARPSYELFPADPPSRDQARSVVAQNGVDGILVATVKSVRETTRWQPSPTMSFWRGPYGYYGAYGPGWSGAYSTPGYLVTDETVRCETSLWDARVDDKLVWSASTRTVNPENGPDFVRSVTRAVVPELTKGGFILPSTEPDE